MSHDTAAALAAELDAHAERAAGVLKAMGHPLRLRVLCLLLDGELQVAQINAQIPISQSALSQHLGVLRAMGLVRTRRSAQAIYYALAPGPVAAIIATLRDTYCRTDATAA
jgi:DNA-binding transcriptional ArsR family regulator